MYPCAFCGEPCQAEFCSATCKDEYNEKLQSSVDELPTELQFPDDHEYRSDAAW
jgi:hypothetical protein